LLIGGATTSQIHTAVKIEPNYSGSTVYVPDASRAVGVVSALLSDSADRYKAEVRAEYESVRLAREGGTKTAVVDIDVARANRAPIEWAQFSPAEPTFTGVRTIENISLGVLRDYIDWTPSSVPGSRRRIPPNPRRRDSGRRGRELLEDTERMLDQMISEQWIDARAVVGFWPANAVDDDITVFTDGFRCQGLHRRFRGHNSHAC